MVSLLIYYKKHLLDKYFKIWYQRKSVSVERIVDVCDRNTVLLNN